MTSRCGAALATLALVCVGCSSYEPGLSLRVGVAAGAPSGPTAASLTWEGGTLQLDNGLGQRITVRQAYATLFALELLACDDSVARRWGAAPWMAGLAGLGRSLLPVRTAWAHSDSTATRLGTPLVVGLVGDAQSADPTVQWRARVGPPPGSYCRLRVIFGPADEDADGLDAALQATGMDLRGATLVAAGVAPPPAAGAMEAGPPRDFALRSAQLRTVEVPFRATDGHQVSLVLSRAQPTAGIVLGFDLARWWSGIDPLAPPEQVQEQLVANLAAAVMVTVAEPHELPPS
jgi:hypothetical protein